LLTSGIFSVSLQHRPKHLLSLHGFANSSGAKALLDTRRY
jgi:hypothetical protein